MLTDTQVPHMTFHGLRHLRATMLLSSGVPLPIASKILGHSTVSVTCDLYGHLLDDTAADAAALADAYFERGR